MWLAIALFAGFALGWLLCAMLTVGKDSDAWSAGYLAGRDDATRDNP